VFLDDSDRAPGDRVREALAVAVGLLAVLEQVVARRDPVLWPQTNVCE
jgi:hypothetical protein